jgi:hypothetical protein
MKLVHVTRPARGIVVTNSITTSFVPPKIHPSVADASGTQQGAVVVVGATEVVVTAEVVVAATVVVV